MSKLTDALIHWIVGHSTINKCCRRQWGLIVEEGAMMMTTKSTSVPTGVVGKGDGNCNGDGDGDSDSGGNAFNNQQML